MTILIQTCVFSIICVFVRGNIPYQTCFNSDPIRKLDGTNDGAFIGSYIDYVESKESITNTIERVFDTGSGEDLLPGGKTVSYSATSKRYIARQFLSVTSGNHRVGAFFCNSTHVDEDPSYIPTIILANEAYIKPEKQTQTVSFGETVTIRMNLLEGNVADLRWRLNENIIESWSGMVNITIQYVTKTDAGIYECYLNNRRTESKHAIMRLIVRGCSASRWGPDCENLCSTCYNGGVCDDVTGSCVCPPGFKANDCSFGCGNNNWGITCSTVCSSASPGCPDRLACVPDPVGCSCMAGYKGLGCTEECEAGLQYGSTCSEECHCASDEQCDTSTGCPDGPCANGYSGKNCQVPYTCPDGWYGELCKYHCHCEDDGSCEKSTGSCGERKCRHLWIGSDCQLDGRTNVSLIIPDINQGASVTITCIVQANPIPNEEDIHVLNNDDVSLVSGVFTVKEDNYTRTVVYSDVNVTKGEVFKCQVTSSVAGDEHAEKSVTIYDPPVLTTPPSVTASDSTVTVSWNQWNDTGVENGDGPVIGYYLCYIMTESSSRTSCIESGLDLTASFDIDSNDDFQRGIDYDFEVGAKRSGSLGTGPVSPFTTFTIPCLSPEVVPTIVTVSSLSTSEIQVQWQLIDSEHWRCNSLDYYTVEYKQDGSFKELNVSSTETAATISNLDPCTTYHIQVTATNSAGVGPSSDIVTVTTDTQEPGDLVLQSVISSSTSLTVNWNVPNNPECITSFIVNYTLINLDQCNTSVDIAGSQNFSATSTQGILTNLWSYSLYGLSVYAVFGSETTQPAVIEANTSTSKPGRPLAISIADIQETELSFTWQLPECGNRNGPITIYRARLRTDTSTDAKELTELSVTFSSLSPCTQYTFQVRAVSGDTYGTWSEDLPVQTASQAPDRVRNVTIIGDDTSLVVSWEAPDTEGCQIGFYKLEYELVDQGLCGENSGSVTETHTTETSFEIDNLEVYSRYSVTISAVIGQVGGAHNFEGLGTTEEGITAGGEPLVGPENILGIISQEATDEAPGAIEISFGSVPCLQKGGTIVNYIVQVIDGDGEVLGIPSTVGATPAIITGAYPCQSVTPQVAACTLTGCGEFANGSTVTMNAAAPGKVSVNVESVPSKSKRLSLTWSAPDVVYCPIVEYKIEYKYTSIDQCQHDVGENEVIYVNGTETMTTLTGLIPFTTYDVIVSAGVVGRNGDKIFTTGRIDYGYTEPAAATAPPDNIIYNNTMDAQSLHFSWDEIPCGERRGVIEKYKYTLNGSNVLKQSAVEFMFVNIGNLIPCTSYTFMVSGKGPGGQGPDSDSIEATTIAEVPGNVENIVVQEPNLVWERPPPLTCDIVQYHIDANLIKKDQCQETDKNANFTVPDAELELSRLEPYSTYRVTISAETEAGLGPQTTHEFITPEEGPPTSGPKEVSVTSVSATGASFAWSEIECGFRRGPIIGYKFSIQTADGQEEIITDEVTTELECDVYTLMPFTGYIFSVKGYNLMGDSESKELNITTNESLPTVPQKIKIVNMDTESFLIEWSRPEPPNGIVIIYQLNYTVVDGFENMPESLQYIVSDEERDTLDFSYKVEGLQANTNYTVQAAALTSVGIGPWSDELFVFTITGKPGYVHNLFVLYAEEEAIMLSWGQPLNPNGVITNYYVQYRLLQKVFEPDTEITLEWLAPIKLDGDVEEYLLSSLDPATEYEIQVFAKTSAGEGEPRTINQTTPTPPVTEQPTMSIVSTTDTTITVNLEPIPNFIYVSNYVILVEKKTGAKRRDVIGTQHPTYEDSPNNYVTASFPRDSVPGEFTVGDGKTYDGYINAPLAKDIDYNLLFAADINGKLQTEGAEGHNVQTGEDPPVGLIVGLVFLFLLAIVVAAMVITLKRRRGFRARPMYPMKTIPKVDSCIPHVPSEDTLADIVNDNNPPIAPKPENIKPARVHRPVKIEHLVSYVKKKRMNQNEGFLHDFESLPDQQMYSWDVAKKSGNKTKNRYGNIVAYDHCRVVLDVVPGDPHSDYINACYIDGYKQKNVFIATQGPNTASVQDIWRMVWQECSSVIVMVTNLSEAGKKKCEKYWPDNSQTYGSIDVKNISEENYPQYTVRTFKITKDNEDSREIKQFHFTVWPDMGVPEFASDILRFIAVVKENGDAQTGPTIVHCSAGVGRTGTLIAISEMLDMARDEGRINVFNFVHQMRTHRVKMVQTSDQYFFIFDALLEAVVCGQTSTKSADMNSFYSSLLTCNPLTKRSYILEQYNALEAMSVVTTEENTIGGKSPDNVSKNRFPGQVPIDGSRPYLMTLSSEGSTNYINASFLHGYRGKDMYISTQMPMPNTMGDFWCMVYDYKSKLIVMLNEEDSSRDQTYGKYWPDSESVQHGPMTVEHVSTEKSRTAICRTFKLKNTLRMKEEPRQIKQYQYLGWQSNGKTPASAESVLEFLKLLDGEGSTDAPITVHCKNGTERCGLFCTIHSVFQRLQQENIVDIFHTIRKLRRSRATMVAPVSQYEFCFKMIQCYLDAFEIYSNYK